MSFQAYLKNIKTKTGLEPLEFRQLAKEKGLTYKGEIMATVKANAVVKSLQGRVTQWLFMLYLKA